MSHLAAAVALAGTMLLLVTGPGAPPAAQSSASGSPHAYFERLVARPDHLVSYSLRSPDQLVSRDKGGFTHSNTRDQFVHYAPARDTYSKAQDAAKIVIPANGNSLRNQVRLPFDHGNGGFLITWDAWWGEEFAFEHTGIKNYKAFQLESGGRIWTEIRSRFQPARRFPGAIALVDVRPYRGSSERKGARVGGVNYGNGSLGGLLTNFGVAPNTWTRYWVSLVPRKDSEFWDFSLWVADERRDAVLLYDKEGIKPKGMGWDRFWLEYNTSTSKVREGRGELVAYARNVVVLKVSGSPPQIFDRPRPGPARGAKP